MILTVLPDSINKEGAFCLLALTPFENEWILQP